jgi:hypothetical protein
MSLAHLSIPTFENFGDLAFFNAAFQSLHLGKSIHFGDLGKKGIPDTVFRSIPASQNSFFIHE